MKFYLAAGRQHRALAAAVIERLEGLGHECTFAWAAEENWQLGYDKPKTAAELDRMGVCLSQAFIGLLPGGPGTHVELGMALALKKPVLLIDLEGGGAPFDPKAGNVFYAACRQRVAGPNGPPRIAGMIEEWLDGLELTAKAQGREG